jgi:hypothetical protein
MWFEEVGRGFQSSHAFGKGMWSRALAHRMCQLIAFGDVSSSTALNGGHYAFKGQHAVSLERSTASKPCEETSS